MRKLLLATVAALGASMGLASYADAQGADAYVTDSTDGQSYPTPGTVTVRLNGRYRFYVGAMNQGAARTSNFATNSTATTTASGINKLSNYGTTGYLRLYPGFDGVAANGLKYGASVELRQDNNYIAGGGAYGSITGDDRTRGLPYIRREWGYIGTDRFGTLRFGATDQPSSLYLTGTFENFDDGGLDGDLPSFLPGAVQTTFPFADQGNLYSTDKIVYLSPQFYGFDGGVSFEPTTASVGSNNGSGCGGTAPTGSFFTSGPGVASPGCENLSSTSTGDVARRKDTYEGLIRYRGTFGPVGVAATASYDGSGRVTDDGVGFGAPTATNANPKRYKFEDLSVGDFGLVMTIGGLSFGGNYQIGRYNVQGGGGFGGLVNKGQPDGQAFIVGATYTIGPVIFGAHYMRSLYEGDQVTATGRSIYGVRTVYGAGVVPGGQRRNQGAAAGATYSVAPGIALYLSALWEEQKQNGYNFITGTSNSPLNNKTSASVFAVGTSFAW
jgi:hypothetical protein